MNAASNSGLIGTGKNGSVGVGPEEAHEEDSGQLSCDRRLRQQNRGRKGGGQEGRGTGGEETIFYLFSS